MDVPRLRIEAEKVEEYAESETEDREWNTANNPASGILREFPPEFDGWVNGLCLLLLARRGGMPLDKNDLSLIDWLAMGIIENHRRTPPEAL
jgi:hypothetical protein